MTQPEERTLRELRLSRGVGLNELARISGISSAILSKLERGLRATMNGRYAQRIGEELQYSTDTVMQAFYNTRNSFLATQEEPSPNGEVAQTANRATA